MAERQFKRKHKPASKQKAEKASRVASEKVAAASRAQTTQIPSASQQNQPLGMAYSAGPVFNLAAAELERAQNDEQLSDETNTASFEKQLDVPPKGDPLESAQRKQLERRFGRSFAHVQVHRGPLAQDLTDSLGTKAFAYRQHIWLGDRADKSDTKLLAHELTHVVQQGYAPALQYRAPITFSSPANDPVNTEHAAHSQQAVAPGHTSTQASGNVAPAGNGAVQGFDLWDAAVSVGGTVASTAGNAVDFVTDIPGNLAQMGLEQGKRVLRRVAPNFLAFFENDGISGFLNRIIRRGVRSLFSGILETIRRTVNVDSFASGFNEATRWLSTMTSEMGANACDAILSAARHVREFFSDTFGPIVSKVSGIACQVKGFLNGIWDSLAAPIWDFLRNIGGEIWESVRDLISDAADLIRSARRLLGSAWGTVKQWLGIEAEEGENEGGGLWEWVREKASDIGESVSKVLKPVMDPLRDAAGVLLLFVPGGQIAAVMLLWPRLRQAFDWISGIWGDLKLIPRARVFLTETVFPFLMDAAESVAQALLAHADWMIVNLSRFVGLVQGLVGAIPSFLAPFRPVASFMLRLFQRILRFARTGIRYVSRHFRSLVRKLLAFLERVGRALVRIISIVLNPFGLVGFLVGSLWQLLPDCIKGPLIDFILDILIGFIRRIPNNPLLGILWPVIQSGLLGFLETVRELELQRRVNIANKVANIVAGGSPSFIVGYFTGIITGLWQAIVGPIQAIATIFELPSMVQGFLANLGVRLCEIIDQIRCFARNLASEVFGRVDRVLSSIQEFLSDPVRILSLIRCAVEGMLSGARSLGGQLAQHMTGVFEGPDEDVGRALGNITGQILFQAVLGFFTAGAGTAVSSGLTIVNRVAGVLRTVGRAIGQAVRVLRQLLGRLVSFVRGLASRLGSAVARGGRNIFSRLGSFFARFGRWLARIGRRAFSAVRRRFLLTPQQRLRWQAFKTQARAVATRYPSGTTKANLRTTFRALRNRYRDVAKWPAFIAKHGPHWRLWARRVKSIRPRRVGRVLMDRASRWRAGGRAIERTVSRRRRLPGNLTLSDLGGILRPIKRRYHYVGVPRTTFDPDKNEFKVHWAMSNEDVAAKVGGEVPDRLNLFRSITPGRSAVLDNFAFKNIARSAPLGTTPTFTRLEKILSYPSYRAAAYVRGHLISGYFTHGYPSNWLPITRSANWWMEFNWEGHIKRAMKSRAYVEGKVNRGRTKRLKFYKLTVSATGSSGGTLSNRRVIGTTTRRQELAEQGLATRIDMNIVRKTYDAGTGTFRENPSLGLSLLGVPRSSSTTNVPNIIRYPPSGYPYGRIRS